MAKGELTTDEIMAKLLYERSCELTASPCEGWSELPEEVKDLYREEVVSIRAALSGGRDG